MYTLYTNYEWYLLYYITKLYIDIKMRNVI